MKVDVVHMNERVRQLREDVARLHYDKARYHVSVNRSPIPEEGIRLIVDDESEQVMSSCSIPNDCDELQSKLDVAIQEIQEIEAKIKISRELDVAVARAIGWTGMIHMGLIAGLKEVNVDTGPQYVPHFSTDLNDAFAAAEKAVTQAWEKDQRDWDLSTFIGRDERGWTCSLGCDEHRVFAPTPALAICAAILKLKEATKESP